MASFVPYHQKKSRQLAKHESTLITLLHSAASPQKILSAAAAVRNAHIAKLKSQAAQLPASDQSAPAIAQLHRQMEHWLNLSDQSLLALYRNTPKPTQKPNPSH